MKPKIAEFREDGGDVIDNLTNNDWSKAKFLREENAKPSMLNCSFSLLTPEYVPGVNLVVGYVFPFRQFLFSTALVPNGSLRIL